MNTNKIQIYQFSTGIDAVINNDGTWYSRGFTGNYIKCTINPIPKSVQTAIANDLFKIPLGKSSQQPAIIGRVIKGNPDWSVIAIITCGIDDQSRSINVTRYFLSEGEESLWSILLFIINYRNKQKQFPIFDPSIKLSQPINDPTQLSRQPLTSDEITKIGTWTVPFILCDGKDKYQLESIHQWAEKKAEMDNKQISWSYNVEGLAKPESFLLIHTANQSAFQTIQNQINTINPAIPYDDKTLKLAISTIINSHNISHENEAIEEISLAISNKTIKQQDWHQLFDKYGANQAIPTKNSSNQTARLLTLRAIIIPATLVELLQWLELENHEQYWQACLDFSQQFYQSPIIIADTRKIINSNLEQGLHFLLIELFSQQVNCQNIAKLLSDKNSIWKHYQTKIIADIQTDLTTIATLKGNNNSSPKNFNFDKAIWNSLIKDIQTTDSVLPWKGKKYNTNQKFLKQYQPLSDLFADLYNVIPISNIGSLYCYFSQVSQGEVYLSKKQFERLFNNSKKKSGIVYDLIVYRKLSGQEKITDFMFDKIFGQIPIQLTLLLLFLATLLLGEFAKPVNKLASVGLCIPFMNCKEKITAQQIDNALAQFDRTIESLAMIHGERTWGSTPSSQRKEIMIETICGGSKCLEWGEPISQLNKAQKIEWVNKIWNYQQEKKGIKADGIIGDQTRKKILDQINYPNSQSSDTSTISQAPEQNPENQTVTQEKLTIPEGLDIQTALSTFETTKISIKNLVESPASSTIYENPETAINEIKLILSRPRAVQELDSEVILDSNNDQNATKKWIIAIYEYQQELGTPDGIVRANGNTIKDLTVDLLFEPTRQAIQTLVQEVVTQTETEEDKVKLELKKLLNGKPKNITVAIEGEGIKPDYDKNKIAYIKQQQFALMEAIKTYKKLNLTTIQQVRADGIIQEDDLTYNDLKTKIRLALLPEPSNTNKPSGQ